MTSFETRRSAPIAIVGGSLWWATVALGVSGCGGDAAATTPSAGDAAAAGEDVAKELPGSVELGDFRVRDLMVSEAQARSLQFTLHLTAEAPDVERLEHLVERRRQAIRHHVIVAVRGAESIEFDEPGLNRLARRVLLRLHRALGERVVSGVFFSDVELRIESPS